MGTPDFVLAGNKPGLFITYKKGIKINLLTPAHLVMFYKKIQECLYFRNVWK
jgi:hypothetical protein